MAALSVRSEKEFQSINNRKKNVRLKDWIKKKFHDDDGDDNDDG